jgi:glycosyltransferase involved in cell wall biosynthesis
MLISILIPTRNRCELLSQCIYTILKQEDSNFEIIISDNFSEDDTYSVVSKLNDKRIKYFRQECLVSVTENWNYALSKASGEYHLMLGDDDGLTPIFFENIRSLIKKYNSPELIRFSGYSFIFPGALKLNKYNDKARLRNYLQPEIIEKSGELILSDFMRKNMVIHSLNFKHRFEFNMQFSLVSKYLQKRMESFGKFYQSPYPDFYASNALLLEAKTNVWTKNKLVIVGLSTKSFGHYYFNGSEKEGVDFLGNKTGNWAGEYLVNILPGPDNNTFWYLAMEAIRSSLPKHHNLIVNVSRYRFLQTGYFLRMI